MAGFAERYTLEFVDRDPSIAPADEAGAIVRTAASVSITAAAEPDGARRLYRGAGAGDDLQVTVGLDEHGQVHLVPGSISWPRSHHLLGDKGLRLRAGDTGRLLSAA